MPCLAPDEELINWNLHEQSWMCHLPFFSARNKGNLDPICMTSSNLISLILKGHHTR